VGGITGTGSPGRQGTATGGWRGRRAVLAGLAATALVGGFGAAPAAAATGGHDGDPVLDLSDVGGYQAGPGLQCEAVPVEDGGTLRLRMVVTGDSSGDVATAGYYAVGVPADRSASWVALPVGTGLVRVVSVTETALPSGVTRTAQRWGPDLRDSCSFSDPGVDLAAEVLHLEAVPRPALADVLAWCAEEGVVDCPTEVAGT
jgi:hypothetical protein